MLSITRRELRCSASLRSISLLSSIERAQHVTLSLSAFYRFVYLFFHYYFYLIIIMSHITFGLSERCDEIILD